MNPLAQEVHVMQNPALGALLLWRFTQEYAAAHPSKSGAPLPFAFLVLPLVWHAPTAEAIERTLTASGLRKYAAKFTETDRARDILLGINGRVKRWRPKTLAALRTGLATGLFTLSPGARLQSTMPGHESDSNPITKLMEDNAEKLGVWFASLSPHEVSLILHVEF